VPFGEYVPFESVLPFVGTLAREAGRFTAGTEPSLLPWANEQLGLAICYEVVFAAPVAEQVRAGATLLVTITNDAWYGDSSAPWQHLRAARFRAAENRRPMARAALTGVSALIDASGAVGAQMGIGERGVLRARMRGQADLSPFSRAPWLATTASWLLAAFGIIRVRRRPTPTPPEPSTSLAGAPASAPESAPLTAPAADSASARPATRRSP
jgi:apolipoprotein N-acyltransferase